MKSTISEPWHHKYAWLLFALVGLSGLIPGIQISIDPLSGGTFLASFGYPIPDVILADAEALAFLSFFLRWTGLMVIGVDGLTIVVAATAFRRGERWAWWAFWYWPLVFLAHFFMYDSAFRFAQLVWLALTALALLATYKKHHRPIPAMNA
jgi:hypothetical protein